jgi:hypothetical protein
MVSWCRASGLVRRLRRDRRRSRRPAEARWDWCDGRGRDSALARRGSRSPTSGRGAHRRPDATATATGSTPGRSSSPPTDTAGYAPCAGCFGPSCPALARQPSRCSIARPEDVGSLLRRRQGLDAVAEEHRVPGGDRCGHADQLGGDHEVSAVGRRISGSLRADSLNTALLRACSFTPTSRSCPPIPKTTMSSPPKRRSRASAPASSPPTHC